MNNSILWYTTRGAGAVSLILFSAVVVLGVLSSLRFETTSWPRFLTTGLHRNLSLMALVFLALHIVTALVDPFTHLGWLAAVVPFSSYYRTLWLGLGVIAVELMIAIAVTSLVRGVIGHGAWRAIHLLAYASWPIAVVHSFGTGTDNLSAWMLVIDVVCILAVAGAVVARLLARPPDPLAADRARFRERVSRHLPR
jgi:methionine sulfoxide reductase heme-binding subunit